MLGKKSTKAEFVNLVNEIVQKFRENRLVKALDQEKMNLVVYHSYLKMIFHQVKSSSSTFALAASNCTDDHQLIKEYLFLHAEEEKTHWRWIINDLNSTDYSGSSPENEFPHISAQSYIAFNYYIANRMPIARLGIAYMLENIGGNYGKKSAQKVCNSVGIKANQATFLFGHGDTDVGHSKEILGVLEKSKLSPEEWGWMKYAAYVSGDLYKKMYDDVLD